MERKTDPVAALAALNEPVRRRIYYHVVSGASEVSRDVTAAELGVPRSVAAFHLDKLVEAGLLEVEYRRPPGRGGPGAGRPAKWYRRAAGEINVSIPERRYVLAAALLAHAVERAIGGVVGVDEALRNVAREQGYEIGKLLDRTGSERGSVARHLTELLVEHGFEPRMSSGLITLTNCPFHVLADEYRELICSMNHELLCGVAAAAGLPASAARLDPAPGRCCVTLVA